MGRVEPVDVSGLVNPGRRLELQKAMNEAQFTLKWLGKGSPDRNAVEAINASPTRQPSQKTGTGSRSKNSNSLVKQREILSVRTKATQISSREPLLENGGTGGRIVDQIPTKDQDDSFEVFKREFIEKLAEKAKERPGYLLANEDFVKPVKGSPKLSDEGFVRPVRSHSLPKQTDKDYVKLVKTQSKLKLTPSNAVYDLYATDEEATPRVHSSRRRMLLKEHNAAQKTKIVGQEWHTSGENQDLVQMTEQSEQSREDQDFFSGESLEDRSAQGRRDMPKASSGSPGRGLSSEARKKDPSMSPGRKLSSEEKRSDLSRSPGKGFSSEERKRDCSRSPGRKLPSEERRKDSSQISTRSIGGVFAAEDLRTTHYRPTRVLNESPTRTTQPEITRLSNSGQTRNKGSESEAQQESVRRETEAMLKSVKKAAAVDQVHFLRALQDNGAAQSSPHTSRASSPNGTKNSNNLREARGNYRVDVRRDSIIEVRETRSREPSPTGRREIGSCGSSTRSREPSPTGRRDAASFRPFNRSREPPPTGRRVGTSGSTNVGVTAPLRITQGCDTSSEKGSLRSGEIQRNSTGEQSQLPYGGHYPSCDSPRLSRQSSSRSTGSGENESVSGGSIIERLMRKASLRNRLISTENQTISSSVPNPPPPSSSSKTGSRRTLKFADPNTDIRIQPISESFPRQTRLCSPTSGATLRRSCAEATLSEDLSLVLSERKGSPRRVTSVVKQSAACAPNQEHPLSNSLRVNVQVEDTAIAKIKSRISTPPVISDSKKLAIVKTVEESCRPIATPERTLSSVTSSGDPLSPGSDDSSSEASGIEQPSPVSVLSYSNKRTPFQEDSRLSPLEHKLQVLHERIRKSKTDVTNQKKARLEKIKAREAELSLSIITELKSQELLGVEVPKALQLPKAPEPLAPRLLLLDVGSDVEEKKPFTGVLLHVTFDGEEKKPVASVIAVTRDEKLEKARRAGPISDFCTSLETFDLKNIRPYAPDKKWDLVYIRDVLMVSNFGRDRSTTTKWHSATEPMDPCLFEKLEEFYRLGKKFSGSQFLTRLAASQEGHLSMQQYVQRIFVNPKVRFRGAVDTMNRCHLFDAVNETLAKKLIPYVVLPRPWMKPLSKPVVRPRPTGSTLMQEIWADIYDQIGNNGSMSMDKAQLHQSLEELISEDLFKRTDLFPSREVERAVERVGIELERRILDDLLIETIISLRKFV